MLVPCDVLRPFLYSENGIDTRPANVGGVSAIPAESVHGLVAAGYIRTKAIGAAPENKAIQSAPENKRAVAKGPRGLWFVMEGDRRIGRGFPTEQAAKEAI